MVIIVHGHYPLIDLGASIPVAPGQAGFYGDGTKLLYCCSSHRPCVAMSPHNFSMVSLDMPTSQANGGLRKGALIACARLVKGRSNVF